jgi:hypothetical protein
MIGKRFAVDASGIPVQNAAGERRLCHAMEPEGKLRRDLFV